MGYRTETHCPACHCTEVVSRSDGWKCRHCGLHWDLQVVNVTPEWPKTWLNRRLWLIEDTAPTASEGGDQTTE